MDFELAGDITDVETIAAGHGVRDAPRLRRFGSLSCTRMKRTGIGKREFKRKKYLD